MGWHHQLEYSICFFSKYLGRFFMAKHPKLSGKKPPKNRQHHWTGSCEVMILLLAAWNAQTTLFFPVSFFFCMTSHHILYIPKLNFCHESSREETTSIKVILLHSNIWSNFSYLTRPHLNFGSWGREICKRRLLYPPEKLTWHWKIVFF